MHTTERTRALAPLTLLALCMVASCNATETSPAAQIVRSERAQAKPARPTVPASSNNSATSAEKQNLPFSGVWNVKWCEKSAPPPASCGGFYVYLTQTGSRICGNHFGSDERMNRMDEGTAKSVIGTVVGSTAVLAITSGRNDAIYLVGAKLERSDLSWQIVGTVKEGSNGEPDFIADKELLSKNQEPESLSILEDVKTKCASRTLGSNE